jgi:hypothetical protein
MITGALLGYAGYVAKDKRPSSETGVLRKAI